MDTVTPPETALFPRELGPRQPKRWFAALFLLAVVLRGLILFEPWSGLVPDFNSHFGAWGVGEPAQLMVEQGVLVEHGMPTLWRVELPDGTVARDVYTHHPALYTQLVALSLRVFGNTEWAVRLVPFVFSLFSLVVAWRFVRWRFGEATGLMVAAWMAVMPLFTWYGLLAWTEGVLVGIGVLQLGAYVRWREGGDKADFWRMMGWQFVAVMFDWSGTFMCIGIGLHALLHMRPDWKRMAKLLWLGVPIFLAVSVHAVHMYLVVGGAHQRLETTSILGHVTELPTTFGDFLVHQVKYAWRFMSPMGAVLLGLGLAVYLGTRFGRRGSKAQAANDDLLVPLLTPATLYIGLFPQRSFNHDFFLMISMPALCLLGVLGAWSVARLAGQRRAQVFVGIAVLSTALGILREYQVWSKRTSPQLPVIAAELSEYLDSPRTVVLTHFGRGMALPFYARAAMIHNINNEETFLTRKRDVLDKLEPDRPAYFIFDTVSYNVIRSERALDAIGNPPLEEVEEHFEALFATLTKEQQQNYMRSCLYAFFHEIYDYLTAHYPSEVHIVANYGAFEVFDLTQPFETPR